MIASRSLGWMPGFLVCTLLAGCGQRPAPEPAPSPPTTESSRNPEPGTEPVPIIALTPRAAASIRQIVQEGGIKEPCYLRVRVVSDGKGGFAHKLDLDPVAGPEDQVLESNGAKVVIARRQLEMLSGSQVDFSDAGNQRGFTIRNPNFEGAALKRWLPLLEKDGRAE